MHRSLVLAVLIGILCSISTMTDAKNVTRHGNDPSFWKNHALVIATVDGVEHRSGKKFFIRLRVAECVPARFPYGNQVTAKYEAPSGLGEGKFGNLLEGLKEGDRVMVLLRGSSGRATLPNGVGEDFAMMPDRRAPVGSKNSADL